MRRLRAMYETFDEYDELAAYRESRQSWLEDYALFEALRGRFDGKGWWDWPRELATRQPAALRAARQSLHDEIEFVTFCQYVFDKQWRALRDHATQRGVRMIGDVPIYVDYNSADVWADRKLFLLDRHGRQKLVAGAPPDAFNRRGQVWGSPLYDWDEHIATGFSWWVRRFVTTLRYFDVVRIDHFLGLHRCFAIPAGDRTAKRGTWQLSPGRALLAAVKRAVGSLPLIAEDLGNLTEQAAALRDRFDIPGMRILEWGLDGDAYHQPHNWPRRAVAYTGTHDCNTAMGWYTKLSPVQRRFVRAYVRNEKPNQLHTDLIASVLASPANLAIIPMQDWLNLGSAAQFNRPGTRRGNWVWRATEDQCKPGLARQIAHMTATWQRSNCSSH